MALELTVGRAPAPDPTKQPPDDIERRRLKEVCQEFEAFLVKEVLKGMKSAAGLTSGVFGDGPAGAGIQMSIADDQFSNWISRSGGFGLGKMLYEALTQPVPGKPGKASG